MASSDMELQGVIVPRLKGYAPLNAIIGSRVYDHVPVDNNGNVAAATFPYVTIGESQTLVDDATCITGEQVFLTLHAWSREKARPEARQIAGEVKAALHRYEATLPTWRLVSLNYRNTRVFRDPDGITSHAVIEFVASVERLTA